MTVTGFRLFEDAEYNEDGENPITLARLLARVPVDVPSDQIRLRYAGCGSHDVNVEWGEPDPVEPEPEPEPPPAPSHPSQADPPVPPAEWMA